MASVGYIMMEEIPGIYRLCNTPGVVISAPLAGTPVDPDVASTACIGNRIYTGLGDDELADHYRARAKPLRRSDSPPQQAGMAIAL